MSLGDGSDIHECKYRLRLEKFHPTPSVSVRAMGAYYRHTKGSPLSTVSILAKSDDQPGSATTEQQTYL